MEMNQQLIAAYKQLANDKGTLPVSKKEIAHAANITIEEFVAIYPTIEAIQEAVWVEYLRDTLEMLENSGEFLQYSVREKLLAFYFTFFEQLATEREFVLMFEPKLGVWNYNPTFLVVFKTKFLEFAEALIQEGLSSKEISDRLMMGSTYGGWHWPQMLFLLNKWIEDKTDDHALSDQAVEKAVNLGFDIMGRNVLDSAFDFAKFMVAGH
jgi:hypothetical protein